MRLFQVVKFTSPLWIHFINSAAISSSKRNENGDENFNYDPYDVKSCNYEHSYNYEKGILKMPSNNYNMKNKDGHYSANTLQGVTNSKVEVLTLWKNFTLRHREKYNQRNKDDISELMLCKENAITTESINRSSNRSLSYHEIQPGIEEFSTANYKQPEKLEAFHLPTSKHEQPPGHIDHQHQRHLPPQKLNQDCQHRSSNRNLPMATTKSTPLRKEIFPNLLMAVNDRAFSIY
uniref:Uncharacterized protein n=1 Tax=Glossina pallidipes TaxID=7398 RepID=A0A1A9ZZI5_GLOPL